MFLIFYFWSWIFDKSSKFWAASCKKESNLLLVRFTVCIESCLRIGWRTEKIRQSAALFWFGLQNDGIIYLRAAIQRTIDVSPAFMEYGLAKKIAAWAHANREPPEQAGGLEAFLHGAAQNFEVVLNIQDQK